SSIYLTAPVPISNQPWYHNAVIAVETSLSAHDLLQTLHQIEADFGRVRSVQNAPRVIDIDVLDYNGTVSSLKELELPHPRMVDRAFVLFPLSEIAPAWCHPVTGISIDDYIAALSTDQSIKRDNSPEIMGIINVTPDSFSDGGAFYNPDKAIEHGLRLIDEGARYLDIGGESTRPNAISIAPEEELRRILPVIRGLKNCGAVLSVDTFHASTMAVALKENIGMINDITALEGDAKSISVLKDSDCQICLMHMQGTPSTMQNNPVYKDVVADVVAYLERRVAFCETNGIARNRLVVDPGIGFGKNLAHSIELLRNLSAFHVLPVPILLGASRKSFIAKIMGRDVPASDRLGGSLAAVAAAVQHNIDIVRVHDVQETRQFLDVYTQICCVSS
ncbi:MAG: dihydropteroate synthase, partial [Pseudomonadota bacterium]